MNLFINSPAHYTEEFGVNDDVYKMCQCISQNIDIKKYTVSLDTIGIIPMIAPSEIIAETEWKEVKYISIKFRMASISLCSDYERFCNADSAEKKEIILENVLDSLKIIKKKLKGKFDYAQMETDIKSCCKKHDGNEK